VEKYCTAGQARDENKAHAHKMSDILLLLLALQPASGVVFYSPLAGFSLLAYEVS